MSIVNAKVFLEKIQDDNSFRTQINGIGSEIKFSDFLKEQGINFSSSEAEEAFNMLHVSCQLESEAESLKNAYLYYQLIVSSFNN